jgi:hypothetical protein
MRVDLENIASITQWPIPTNVIEVRSFMGACQYLRKFIVNLSIVATPLHAMTSKEKSFHWGKTEKISFENSKKKINNSPFLFMSYL